MARYTEAVCRICRREGDKLFLRLLDEGAPFFSLKLVYEGERLVSSSLNVTGK